MQIGYIRVSTQALYSEMPTMKLFEYLDFLNLISSDVAKCLRTDDKMHEKQLLRCKIIEIVDFPQKIREISSTKISAIH